MTAQMQLCLRLPTLAASRLCRILRRRPQTRESLRILVVRLDGIGDCVLTLPLLDALRSRYPSSRITVLVSPAAATLFAGHPSVDEVLTLNTLRRSSLPRFARTLVEALRTWWVSLRGREFDIAISPRWDADVYLATLLCALTRAAITAGFEDGTSPFKAWLNHGFDRIWTVRVPAGPVQHEVLHGLALAKALGCHHSQPAPPRLLISPADAAWAEAWLHPNHRIPIAIGLPAAEAKRRWTIDGYLASLRQLDQHAKILPVLLADDDTASDGRRIAEAFPEARTAHRLPLAQTAAILSQCALFIGSDSGLGHIAAAVGCPTITLSPHPADGDPSHPNSPLRFRPYGVAARVLQPPTGYPGCESACVSLEQHCIAKIAPARLTAAALELLSLPREAPAEDAESLAVPSTCQAT